MLDRTLYAGLSRLVAGHTAGELAPHVEAHIAFMIDLETRGVLFASGPFQKDGKNTGEGLTIVRAGSIDEARAILAGDPFSSSGIRTWDVREWRVMEGAITVTLHASQQRGSLP